MTAKGSALVTTSGGATATTRDAPSTFSRAPTRHRNGVVRASRVIAEENAGGGGGEEDDSSSAPKTLSGIGSLHEKSSTRSSSGS